MRRGWGKAGTWIAMLVAFVVLGMWHDAKWTFLVFGILQGLALIWELLTARLRKEAEAKVRGGVFGFLGIGLTFVFFTLSCIFFRADTLTDAVYVMQNLFAPERMTQAYFDFHYAFSRLELTLIAVVFFLVFDHLICKTGFDKWVGHQKLFARWGIYVVLIGSILLLAGVAHEPFVYYQF